MPAFRRTRKDRHMTAATGEDRTLFNEPPRLEISNVEVGFRTAAEYCVQRFNLNVLASDVRKYAKDSDMRIGEFINAANEHQSEVRLRRGVHPNIEKRIL